jgi:cysteinyl-tRNA synthetase
MIVRHLGYELDICCGGIDNIYRHHDYNIAVVEGVSGKVLAPFWLHGGHVRVKGIKMAKSKGNIVYPDDLFFLGYEPCHVRFFLICSHYRKSLNLTAQGLDLARGRVDTFRTMARRIEEKTGSAASSDPEARALAESLQKDFETSMNNDLDVETAFEKLYNTLQSLVRISAAARLSGKDAEVVISGLKKIDQVLKILY